MCQVKAGSSADNGGGEGAGEGGSVERAGDAVAPSGDGARLGTGDGDATWLGDGNTSAPQPATTRTNAIEIVAARVRSGIRYHAPRHVAASLVQGSNGEKTFHTELCDTADALAIGGDAADGHRPLGVVGAHLRHLERAAPRQLRTVMSPRSAPTRRPK
jgi:hypothetical protein